MKTMKDSKDIKIVFGTDFHFCNPRTPSLTTLLGVKNAWQDGPDMADVDLCIIGGDWMDRMANLSQLGAYEAQEAAIHILTVCAKHNILLRVIEGTTSHDRKQSLMFVELNERLEIGCDVRWVKDLSIEHIDNLGINILYLPDEWHHDSDETLRQGKELIRNHGLVKVDIAVMHVGFKYQFPLDLPSLHDEVEWSGLVNYAILSGHIHPHSRCLKVICGGSFNRNNHDEDCPKGHIRLTIGEGKLKKVKFIENVHAKIYKTVNIFDLEISDVINAITDLGPLPTGSAVRLEYRDPDPIKAIREQVEVIFPGYIFTDVKRIDKKEKVKKRLFTSDIYKPVDITPSSVVQIVMERLGAKGNSEDIVSLASRSIKDTIDENF